MADQLDELIREIQETSKLSAESRNVLHECLSTHPWGRCKTKEQRVMDVLAAIAGRKVDANLAYRLGRI